MGRQRAKRAARQADPPPAPGPRLDRGWILVAGAVLATLVAYARTFDVPFVRDAYGLVEGDPRIREWSAGNLEKIATTPYWWQGTGGALFRPMATLSFLFNYAVLGNGARPVGYHVVNFLLHLLNAAGVFGLVRVLKGSRAPALLAAALFAAHPIATEAVTNVAGRADLLAAAGVLSALWLHLAGPSARHPWRWRLGLLAAASVAVFAKENALVLVPLAFVYDAFFRDAASEGRPRFDAGAYAALGLVIAVWFFARQAALAEAPLLGDAFGVNPLLGLPFLPSRLTAANVVARELALLAWPHALSIDYSYDQIPLAPWTGPWEPLRAAFGLVALPGLGVFAVAARRRAPAAAFGAALLGLALLPTSNLLVRIGSIMAERFLYLPSAGFAMLVAGGVAAAAARLSSARARATLWGAAAVVVAAAAARTYVRNGDWRDEETLLRAAREVVPRSYKVHKALAQTLLAGRAAGPRLDEAVREAEEAVRILDLRPRPALDQSSETLVLLAAAYEAQGDARRAEGASTEAAGWYRRARPVLERAVEVDRAVNAEVRRLSLARGRPAAEVRDVGLGDIYDLQANVALRLGEPEAALPPLAHLRHLYPTSNAGYALTTIALGQAGRADEAAVMVLQAYILEEREDKAAMLRELYSGIDPSLRAFDDAGRLDLAASRVRADLTRACAALLTELEASHSDALDTMRTRCAERYGVR